MKSLEKTAGLEDRMQTGLIIIFREKPIYLVISPEQPETGWFRSGCILLLYVPNVSKSLSTL